MLSQSVRYLVLMGVLIMGLWTIPSVSAQIAGEDLPDGVSQDDVYRVSSQMYCDVCAGIPLSTCASPTCLRWRQEIANLLGEGKSDEDIYTFFADNYGDDVTGMPLEGSDRNFAVGLPALLSLIAGVGVAWQIWRIRQKGESRAMQAAKAAGLRSDYTRPVPDNVDSQVLADFLKLVEGRDTK